MQMIGTVHPKGLMLRGRYRIETSLKTTGLSRVYLATDLKDRCRVVIKQPNYEGDGALDEKKEIRVRAEALVMERTNHPYCLRYIDSWEEPAGFYLVSGYAPGRSLFEKHKGNPPMLPLLREYAIQILEALEHIHRKNIVHRDIKPQNVLFNDRCLLVDFGAAYAPFLPSAALRMRVGTPGYQCPELFNGPMTSKCDLFSMGATLRFLALGVSPGEHTYESHPRIMAVAEKAMGNLGVRYDSALEMINAVREAIPKEPRPFIVHGIDQYPITRQIVTIGRDNSCNVVVADPERFVSPVHCEVQMDGHGNAWLADRSINGTFVYDPVAETYSKIDHVQIHDGEYIVLCHSNRRGAHIVLRYRAN